MEPLKGARMLRAWETGHGRPPVEQALALLTAAGVEDPPERLARLPVGRRDALLLELRALSLGPELEASARCPACSATLFFSVAVADLLAAGGDLDGDRRKRQGEREGDPPREPGPSDDESHGELRRGGFVVRYRCPDSRDLEAAGRAGGPETARRTLLERCVLAAWSTAGQARSRVRPRDLPPPVVGALARTLEEADPLASIPLDLACESCGHRWLPLLDPALFLWREVAGRAERLMHQVSALALAFGWSEGEILAMGEARRQRYLELAPSTADAGPED